MSDTKKRIVVGGVLALIAALAALGQYLGYATVRWLGLAVVIAMMVEMVALMSRNRAQLAKRGNWLMCVVFLLWLCVMLAAINVIGSRPWIVLLMLMTICATDIGAWFFGGLLRGDKLWERISANKTWSGQIAGIACGTAVAILYGLLGTDRFMPQLMWIGISVSLLSQYGDLTASWIKRRMGTKDFGSLLPGHGGLIDRFDGWIYVLPIMWLAMM